MAKTKEIKEIDVVTQIMAYEDGRLNAEEIIELFKHLVHTGLAWKLQGCYGRAARALQEMGLI